MRTRTGAAVTTFGANSLNVVVVSLQALLLIPLYLGAISPRLYGAWLASGEILTWMQAMDLGIPNLMIQRIAAAHGAGDRRTAGEWFASGLLVLGIIGATVAVLGGALSLALPSLFNLDPTDAEVLRGCFIVGTLATALMIVTNGFVGLSRAIQDTAFMSGMVIVSSLTGMIVSVILVLNGWGLWAVALGLVARATVSVVAAAVYGVRAWRREFRSPFRADRAVITELLAASPATALGGASYAIMSQSEIVLVAVLLRPEIALVYALTRKAADVGRGLVDMIGFAAYGGLAHLIGSGERREAFATYTRILRLHLSLALAVAAAYLAVNHSLVVLWLGTDVYGGQLLVFLMTLQCVVLGHSYLINLLYRATGRVVTGSVALLIEACVRLPLLALMLVAFGLPGLPAAAIATAIASALVVHRRAVRELGEDDDRPLPGSRTVWTVRLIVLVLGGVLALAVHVPSWPYVLVTGTIVALAGGFALVVADPLLRSALLSFARRLGPLRPWLAR
jgi:O-antigen/teichoic acid export membrane protein